MKYICIGIRKKKVYEINKVRSRKPFYIVQSNIVLCHSNTTTLLEVLLNNTVKQWPRSQHPAHIATVPLGVNLYIWNFGNCVRQRNDICNKT